MTPAPPPSWAVAPLGDVAVLTKGKKPNALGKADAFLTTPYVTIRVFESGAPADYCDPRGLPLCSEDDVLIVWDGARCGLVGGGVPGVIGSTLAKIDVPGVSRPYLRCFLQAQFHTLNSNPRGVGIPHIDPVVFASLPFPLPPLAEQRRIAEAIETQFARLDAAVAALESARANLRRCRASVLNAACSGKLVPTEAGLARAEGRAYEPASALLERVARERAAASESAKPRRKRSEPPAPDVANLPELPEGWAWATLGGIAPTLTKGTTPTTLGLKYQDSGIRFVKIENLENSRVSGGAQLQYIDSRTHLILQRSQLVEGDILFSIAGTIGNTAVVQEDDLPANTNQALAIIRGFTDVMQARLLMRWLSTLVSEPATRRARGGTMSNIGLSDLAVLDIPIPPIGEQNRIIAEIERLLSCVDAAEAAVEANLKRAGRLRQAILKRAFEGRLVPQDPADESAAALLERVETEKAAATQAARRGRGRGAAKRRGE